MMQDNAELVGEWKVIDIGFEPKCHTAHSGAFYLVERQDVKRILKPRAPFSSKGRFRVSALLVAGSCTE